MYIKSLYNYSKLKFCSLMGSLGHVIKKILGDSYKNMWNLSIFYNPNMDVNLDFSLSFLGLLLWRTAPEAVCRLGCNLTPRSEQAAVCGAADALTGLKIINFFHSNSHCILFLFLFFLSSPYFLSLNKNIFPGYPEWNGVSEDYYFSPR